MKHLVRGPSPKPSAPGRIAAFPTVLQRMAKEAISGQLSHTTIKRPQESKVAPSHLAGEEGMCPS